MLRHHFNLLVVEEDLVSVHRLSGPSCIVSFYPLVQASTDLSP